MGHHSSEIVPGFTRDEGLYTQEHINRERTYTRSKSLNENSLSYTIIVTLQFYILLTQKVEPSRK